MADRTEKILAGAIGRPLEKVVASVHSFGGRIGNGPPLDLWLSFGGLLWVRLFGTPDGWRLGVDETPPMPTDMGEAGEMILTDISGAKPFARTVGRDLEGVWLVQAPTGEVVGVRLDFGLSLKPVILNRDDELIVSEGYPPEAQDEGLEESRIRPVALK